MQLQLGIRKQGKFMKMIKIYSQDYFPIIFLLLEQVITDKFAVILENGHVLWRRIILLSEKMGTVYYLALERNKAQFDVEEMKIVWAGSRHALEVSDRMARLVAAIRLPLLFNKTN
ncbi:uncharacterized protein [Euphorbia lathyris]|uniref:uncharacterized protein isoform X2 n=1 Tax=Euphorbia lathyris TaxID=212925 RepID=UPI00331316AA